MTWCSGNAGWVMLLFALMGRNLNVDLDWELAYRFPRPRAWPGDQVTVLGLVKRTYNES